MHRDFVIGWLSELTPKQLAEVFYEAVAYRSLAEFAAESRHFVLGVAERCEDEPWSVTLVATHDPTAERWDDAAPICQSGSCPACGNDVRSWSKAAVCPVCRSPVGCT